MKKLILPQQKFLENFLKFSFLFIFLIGSFFCCFSQGEILGKVLDENGDGAYPVNIIIVNDSGQKIGIGTQTDFDGYYSLKPLKAGIYNLQVSSLGYEKNLRKAILVKNDSTTIVDFELSRIEKVLSEVVIVRYRQPIITKGQTSVSKVFTSEEIRTMPSRNVSEVSSKSSGAFQSNAGNSVGFKGTRSNGTGYYINGVKVFGNAVSPSDFAPKPDLSTSIESETPSSSFTSTKKDPLSTFSIDVDIASYAIVRKDIFNHILPSKEVVRLEEMINYFSYNYPSPSDDKPFSIHTEMANCLWDTTHHLLKVGIQGKKSNDVMPTSNLVFLIDVSGSMDGYNKLSLVKESLSLLVKQLRKEDKIAIVVYAGSSGLVLPATNGSDKATILNSLNQLTSGGSTAGGAGIVLAYNVAAENFIKDGINRVILCTDGDFNVGVTSGSGLEQLIEEKRKSNVFLSVLGFGDHYSDKTMEMLADKGNGNYAFVDNIKEGEKVFVKQLRGTLNTIAKDVKIQMVFNPAVVRTYKLIGYENRRLKNEEFSNDKIDAGEIGENIAVTALYEVVLNNVFAESSVKLVDNNEKMILAADELGAIQIRYKEPKESKSELLVNKIKTSSKSFVDASTDYKFATLVATFGMKLKGEKAVNKIKLNEVEKMTQLVLGKDTTEEKKEFLNLITLADKIHEK